MQKKEFLINNQIKAGQVRVVDEKGVNLGTFSLLEARRLAAERSLDLVQITEKVEPPVCKIIDSGKFLYQLKKKAKEKKVARGVGEIKTIRIGFNIAAHDLETRAKQAEDFLKSEFKVRVEMRLRGRENRFADFAKEKVEKFLEILQNRMRIKIERELKREPVGFTLILAKQ